MSTETPPAAPPPAQINPDAKPAEVSMRNQIKNLWKDTPTTLPGPNNTTTMKNEPPKPATPVAPITPVVPEAKPTAAAPVDPAPEKKERPGLLEKLSAPDKKADPVPPVDPLAHIEAPKDMSEKAADNWKKLKDEASRKISEKERELATAQAQIETFRNATPAEHAEAESLKKELQTAKDRLAVLDIESHPDFVSQYSAPKNKALAEASEVLGFYSKTADLNQLLSKQGKDFSDAVSKLTEGMNSMDSAAFVSSLRQAHKITSEQKAALSDSGALRESLQSKTAAEQKKVFDETWNHLGGAEKFLSDVDIPDDASPEEKTELSAHNDSLKAVRGAAEGYAFGKVDAKSAAQIASKAAILDHVIKSVVPRIQKEHSRVVAERNALAKELAGIKAAKAPGNFTSTPGTAPLSKQDHAAQQKSLLSAAFKR